MFEYYFDYKFNLDHFSIIDFVYTYSIILFLDHILVIFLVAYLFNQYFSYTLFLVILYLFLWFI